MRKFWIIVAVIIVLVLLRQSFFTVGPTEFVYLTQFGQHMATYDGADADHDAGLHTCWPWPVQAVQRLDRRLQYFDLPATELPTRDARSQAAGKDVENRIDKMLIVEAYVCWRISGKDNVDVFIRKLGTPEAVQDIVGKRISDHLGGVISQLNTRDLINIDADLVESNMNKLWRETLEALQNPMREKYGIDLVDVRLRRFYHSPNVTRNIYETIRAKRKAKAEEYYAKGRYDAAKIEKDADVAAQKIEDLANKVADQRKEDALTDALDIRNQAHKKDKELHEFLQSMKTLKEALKKNKTLLLLSANRSIFQMLLEPPQASPAVGAPPGNGAAKDKSGSAGDSKKSTGGN
jgi:membrane protease subunit HflC